jgi:hypothetical protein
MRRDCIAPAPLNALIEWKCAVRTIHRLGAVDSSAGGPLRPGHYAVNAVPLWPVGRVRLACELALSAAEPPHRRGYRARRGTDRIIRTQLSFFKRCEQMLADPSARFHKATERSLGSRRAGVEQNSVHG